MNVLNVRAIVLAGLLLLSTVPSGWAQNPAFCERVTTLPRSECEALVAFYLATSGNAWEQNAGWLKTPNPCEWYGVDCRSGHVTAITLRDNHLTGPFPPELGTLSELQYLDLGDNHVSGVLPAALGNLVNLRGLNVRNNHLHGQLPAEIGNLVGLEWLYLSQNNFWGSLPAGMIRATHLEALYFRETNLCEPVDTAFQQWMQGVPSLGGSNIACDCQYITEIPEAECTALMTLYRRTHGDDWQRRANWLQTIFPCTWEGVACQNRHVVGLELSNNHLQGRLPPEIGNLTSLQTFDVSHNTLQGTLLPEFGKLTALQTCDVSDNHFEGQPPITLVQLRQLAMLDLSHNTLEGELPLFFGKLDSLTYLDLSHNHFTGMLPVPFGRLTQLTYLDLSNNPIHGNIPTSFGKLTRLGYLDLSATALRGTLPRGFTAFPFLSTLSFQQTNLCTPSQPAFQVWLSSIAQLHSSSLACPRSYQGFWPLVMLLLFGGGAILPALYHASRTRRVMGGIMFSTEGSKTLLTIGVFSLSAELMWGICTAFDSANVFQGTGIGLLLSFGYRLVTRRIEGHVRMAWVGRMIGLLGSLFISVFMLLTVELPMTHGEVFSIGGYVVLLVVPVWFMTSGVTTGGYFDLITEGIFLGGLWGTLTGGALGDFFCYHSAAMYGAMSDILMYQVFSQSIPEDVRRILANEMTGIFVFSLMGGLAGAITKNVLHWVVGIENPFTRYLAGLFRPLFARLRRI